VSEGLDGNLVGANDEGWGNAGSGGGAVLAGEGMTVVRMERIVMNHDNDFLGENRDGEHRHVRDRCREWAAPRRTRITVR